MRWGFSANKSESGWEKERFAIGAIGKWNNREEPSNWWFPLRGFSAFIPTFPTYLSHQQNEKGGEPRPGRYVETRVGRAAKQEQGNDERHVGTRKRRRAGKRGRRDKRKAQREEMG